jgi:hypothetical protein
MIRGTHFIIVVAVLVLTSAPTSAQSMFNRHIGPVAVVPAPGGPAGTYDVSVGWTVSLDEIFGSPLHLSADVTLTTSAGESASVFQEAVMDSGAGFCFPGPPCLGACGSLDTGGPPSTGLLCRPEGECTDDPCDCVCQGWIVTTIPGVALKPGDEITVILIPAAGAQIDPDLSDDQTTVTFTGEPMFWDRRVVSAEIVPVNAEGLFQVWVVWEAAVAGLTAPVNLNSAIYVTTRKSGATGANSPCFGPPFEVDAALSCDVECPGESCLSALCGEFDVDFSCATYELPTTSACACVSTLGILAVVGAFHGLDADEFVAVEIRHVEGAIPGIPSLIDNDFIIPVPPMAQSLDGIPGIGPSDLAIFLAQWGACPDCKVDPCAADFDSDCDVDAQDLGALLWNWG